MFWLVVGKSRQIRRPFGGARKPQTADVSTLRSLHAGAVRDPVHGGKKPNTLEISVFNRYAQLVGFMVYLCC